MAITERLRAATKPIHTQLDHAFYPLIQQVKSTDDYLELLKMFYGFYQPMQEQLDKYLNDQVVNAWSQRRKPSWITDDIDIFTTSSYYIESCRHIPAINNIYQALGAFYVLEGASMGGTIISKKIAEQVINDGNGFRFLNAYGKNNHIMWNNFLSTLETIPQNIQQEEDIIHAAKNTFTAFHHWINQQHGISKRQPLQTGAGY